MELLNIRMVINILVFLRGVKSMELVLLKLEKVKNLNNNIKEEIELIINHHLNENRDLL